MLIHKENNLELVEIFRDSVISESKASDSWKVGWKGLQNMLLALGEIKIDSVLYTTLRTYNTLDNKYPNVYNKINEVGHRRLRLFTCTLSNNNTTR